jgi:hypothetical protein
MFLRRLAAPSPGDWQRQMLRDFGRTVKAVAVSPDGRLLAATEARSIDVLLYETASGRIVKQLAGHSRQVTDLAFAPDGRRLVSVGEDQTGLVWDVTVPAMSRARGSKLTEAWDRLAAPGPGLGYVGLAQLVEAPREAIALLRAKLRPAPVPSDADLDGVVGRLDADTFAQREKAVADLERFGPNAVAGVRTRLARTTLAEVRARLRRFLGQYDGPNPSPYRLRCVRGVATLEAIGTAEARALLAELAKGPARDPLTHEAKAAIERLRKTGGSNR